MTQHYRRLVLLAILAIWPLAFSFSSDTDSWKKLKGVMDNYARFEQEKLGRINKLIEIGAKNSSKKNWSSLFDNYEALFEEYLPYKYDSAFYYATKLCKISSLLNTQEKAIEAKLKMAIVLISGGHFSEAKDSLAALENFKVHFTQNQKLTFYQHKMRLYNDWSNYSNHNPYKETYHYYKILSLDSAILFAEPHSYEKVYLEGVRLLSLDLDDEAIPLFERLLVDYKPTDHQKAMIYACLAYLNRHQGAQVVKEFLTHSAYYDLISVTKETTSLRMLAYELYQHGEYEKAYELILLAYELTDFYGSNHRKFELTSVQPIINRKKVMEVEQAKNKATFYAMLSGGGAIGMLGLALLTFMLFVRNKKKRLIIENAHSKMLKLNLSLREADKIKEEYLGYYFNISTDYVNQIDNLRKQTIHFIVNNKHKEALDILGKYNPKEERIKFLKDFDRIFLRLFPGFVDHFNKLFAPENQFILENSNELTPELRIFALIRLGIHDNEKVAGILNLSVNTIYAYKTKIKNRSLVTNDEFVEQIMKIKSVDD
jgi:hypothetical protein